MFGLFTRVARQVVNTVMGQLTGQINLLNDAVQAPIQAMVSEVTSGVWVGDGADAFVEQCTNLFIPQTQGISGAVGTIGGLIGGAIDRIDEADDKALGLVNDLVDVFDSIF